MPIWQIQPTLEFLQQLSAGTMGEHLGIEFTEIGDDFIKARMPVDQRTFQPAGLLHGGASATLAETLGSVAANFCVNPLEKVCVGLEINANHIRSVRQGFVTGIVQPLHLGGSTQVWEIKIYSEDEKLVCVSRITMAVLAKR
jgi:1,4-dihydroxy-2-naphthoyl-CoA hydrolase